MQQENKILNKRYHLKLQRENFPATMNQHIQVLINACSFMVNMHNQTKLIYLTVKPNIMVQHNVIYIEAWYARDISLGLACTRHECDTSIY